MDLQLEGKRALITGSTAGIGYAIAEGLAKEGATVIVNGRTSERVERAMAQLAHAGVRGKVEALAADLGTTEGVAAAIEKFPDLDILVNNLGIFDPKPFELISDQEWMKFFEVNVLSGVRLSRYYLPRMEKQNWGRIVFISSESAVQIPAEMIQYGMTKTAQLAISRGLAETTAGTGVTVNAVLPGPTASEGANEFVGRMAKELKKSPGEVEQEFFRSMRPTSLLRRFARPDEVAALVTFVCSPLSSATNGAALRVDGGVVRSIL
jgi:NAD(P)-dependent dehydrogenase (short-subunit alcohol dehydrogenase family)